MLACCCAGALLLPLAVAKVPPASGDDGGGGAEPYSCGALAKVPPGHRCSFVRSSCPSESLVPYAELYYCHVAHTNALLRVLYLAAICCLLPLAFCLLGDTAEFYVAPIMAHVSQAIPKMRPRFAGVTFVALGNGAPDLSSNIAAISAGEVVLSAGAITGAAMFVQCIVAGELVALAGPGGIKCGGAMLRDVGVYCLAILSVLLAFAIGQISRVFVGWAIALYLIYMVWVFAGDEWHHRGRPRPRLDVTSLRVLLSGVWPAAAAALPPDAPPGTAAAWRLARSGSRGELEESLLPWAVAEDEEQAGGAGGGFVSPLRLSSPGGVLRASSGLTHYASTELSDFAVGSAAPGSSPRVSSSHGLPGASGGGGGGPRASSVGGPPALGSAGTGGTGGGGTPRHGPRLLNLGGAHAYLDPKTYQQLVWADLADDEEEEERLGREIAQTLLGPVRGRPARSSYTGVTGAYRPPQPLRSVASVPLLGGRQPEQQQQQQQQQPLPAAAATATAAVAAAAADADSALLLSPFGPGVSRTAPGTPQSAAGAPAGAAGSGGSGGGGGGAEPLGLGDSKAWQQLQWQVTLGNSSEWPEAGRLRRAFRKATFPLLLPAYLGQRLTIPFASAPGYSREWLIASLLCCPLALVCYLGLLTLPAVLCACGAGAAAASAAAALTAWDAPGEMPAQALGGAAAAAAPGALAVLAFAMGIVWIDTVATEVVGVITFLGGLAALPAGVMGLTLLAWGNSLGDFFGNRAMARAGHGSTAITACFAAPLFNMLLSLSLGFSARLHRLGARSVGVRLTPEVALGCLFLLGYSTAIVCVGRACGQRLPPWFAHLARAWYALYFGLSVGFGFWAHARQQQGAG